MKKTLITILSFIILIAVAYSGLWVYGYTLVKKQVDNIVNNAEQDGLVFNSGRPKISGFPFKYYIHYGGEIVMDRTAEVIVVPSLSIRSFFFIDDIVEIEMSEGFSLRNAPDEWANSIDYFYTNLIIPNNFPADLTQEGLQDWHNKNGSITFDKTEIIKDELTARAQIKLEVNDSLQPDVLVDSKIYGAVSFIDHLTRKGYLEPKDQLKLTTIISPLSRADDESGEKYTALSLRLRNQSILIGPLQVASYPEIRWPKRNPPAQHQ